jgi:hypothetical protein
MKTIISILFSAFLLFNLNAQCKLKIDTVSFGYFNGLTKQVQKIDNYKITNNSKEEYLTWVSLVPIGNKSNIALIRDFFIKIKGDFNLIGMINENLLNDNLMCEIGYTFIKNILPGEAFSYIIAKTDSNSTFYQDRIVIIKKKEVEMYLNMQIKKKYFSPLNSIVLTGY